MAIKITVKTHTNLIDIIFINNTVNAIKGFKIFE